ncbi:MAG: squalene--hopene cyclase [Burkholderiales bacterium]
MADSVLDLPPLPAKPRDFKEPPAEGFAQLLQRAVTGARDALLRQQHAEGYWSFELQADCTIPAEYILMMHFMDEIDPVLQKKLAVFLRTHQEGHGGWSLYPGGDFDVSGSVKVYYALKLAGDSPDAPHMQQARQSILRHGGAAKSNVFTRFALAMFQQVPWRAVPMVPVEIMLLPRWFPFHLSKVAYWSRTVMVSLAILYSLKATAKNPSGVGIAELFVTPPDQEKNYFPVRSLMNRLLLQLEQLGKLFQPAVPDWLYRRALRHAENWMVERLNGLDGLGAIFPAMVNAHEALALLGYPADHPLRLQTRQALQKLLVVREHDAYCQPCVSPVWDTAIASLALQEAGGSTAHTAVLRGLDWLKERQLLDAPGDWRDDHPSLRGGGWPFQFSNGHYPDIDDTAMVAWAMQQVDASRYQETLSRAAEWVVGMQSKNGGFAAFDADNTCYYLNEIPFADHGALLDPPTSDVSGRCIAQLGPIAQPGSPYQTAVSRSLRYLRAEQEPNGSWFGRWGTNYIYGTWSVLSGLERAGEAPQQPYIQRAVAWLKKSQRVDGGWGEGNDTYFQAEQTGQSPVSNAFQTAWAMLGLMAAGAAHAPEVALGAQYLMRTQLANGLWHDNDFTAPGFPRVFYLKYHGYDKYFPLWALARYRNLCHPQHPA